MTDKELTAGVIVLSIAGVGALVALRYRRMSAPDANGRIPCPNCRERVIVGATTCPHCQQAILAREPGTNALLKALIPLLLIGVAAYYLAGRFAVS